MGIRWTDSAAEHGIAPETRLHAITHAIHAETEFDDPREPATVRPTPFIGPSRTGQLSVNPLPDSGPRRNRCGETTNERPL